MDSLMNGGDSTDSSNLAFGCDAWQNNADFGLYGADPFTTCPAQIDVACSPPYDLNRVIFSPDTQKTANPLQPQTQVPARAPSPPPLPALQLLVKESKPNNIPAQNLPKSDEDVLTSSGSPETESALPLFRALLDRARFVESEPKRR
ncbi:hypothetical protein SLEP1_g57086 [Rubroshorea leprosula]|uniref:Uncharacterized protein n=1 Tax=Rubroshorea leprosula TaxID=152421 RepID=A0AAV5MN04_9ROSI|nr:hypothetical protein SLEP1_g57086 [Rubroshorea leprosula]